MSQIALAEAIDQLVDAGSAFVTESETRVFVTDLGAVAAADLRARCSALAWPSALVDSAGNAWPTVDPPDPDFGPFRLTIDKPATAPDALRLLTNNALKRWLARGHEASQWQIARLTQPLVTQKRALLPWDAVADVDVAPPSKNPRNLVREFGAERQVPDDIRPWLAAPLSAAVAAETAVQVWISAATQALVACLPDELDGDDHTLKFRGPPRLVLPPLADNELLEPSVFEFLQGAMRWVFENDRESEMRHILLANELARSGIAPVGTSTAKFLDAHLEDAWESAQIAYQMALAETSRDTLKVLSDLRKAISEEIAKLSDQTRQLATSVAGALATGLGLVAARAAAKAPADAVAAIMGVVALYVLMVIVSGSQFIRLQRHLRKQWQPRLYRFLPEAEYVRMVTEPVRRAECAFATTAWLGGLAVLLLTLICAWPFLHATPPVPLPKPVAAPPANTTGRSAPQGLVVPSASDASPPKAQPPR